jgi:hypothetical protein
MRLVTESLLFLAIAIIAMLPATAQIVVTGPTIDTTTQGDWRGHYGNCFYLIPQPKNPQEWPEEIVGPDLFSVNPGEYTNYSPYAPHCFGGDLFNADPSLSKVDWRVYARDPSSHAFAWTYFDGAVRPNVSEWNPCLAAFRNGYWDDDLFTNDPLVVSLALKAGGDATIAYYFFNGGDECRQLKWTFTVDAGSGPVTKTGTIGDLANGKYIVFDVKGMPNPPVQTIVTMSAENDTQNAHVCDAASVVPGVNSIIGPVFVSGTNVCTPGIPEICRTPGFWDTHAGTEKSASQNIVQQILTKVGGVGICGGLTLNNTQLHSAQSAEEAMCVSPEGDPRLQLARQLAATALNCVMTNGSASCQDVTIRNTFATCNTACGAKNTAAYGQCIKSLDCYNNGGRLLADGSCQTMSCGGAGVTSCSSAGACGLDAAGHPVPCLPNAGNCHDRALVNTALGLDFDPPGPAGSSNECNAATSNSCTIFSCR